jgi:hypothetical protein
LILRVFARHLLQKQRPVLLGSGIVVLDVLFGDDAVHNKQVLCLNGEKVAEDRVLERGGGWTVRDRQRLCRVL